jgi:hypothetical protein
LSEKVVWQLIQPYAKAAGVAGIAPHDCRRTCAKLCRAAGGESVSTRTVIRVYEQGVPKPSASFWKSLRVSLSWSIEDF